MFKYQCLNPIADVGICKFTNRYQETSIAEEADAMLVRSASMHEMELPVSLKAIARAGAGVNNIPLEDAAAKGIVVFNTPGANANGVKELVIAGLLMAARDIIGGINWVQDNIEDENIASTAEAKKKLFAGSELEGKKLGVIGLGAIGVLVANAAVHLGMDVYGYDPYVSVDSAWQLSRSIKHIQQVDEIYAQCDYITLHVPALEGTINMINKDSISLMKTDTAILNFSRDLLVNTEDIVDALESNRIKKYVTDFPTNEMVGVTNTIIIPHLGASTEESEDNCAKMAVRQIKNFLENGNIKNSVNYPDCDMGICSEGMRITIMHKNIPNMLGQFTSILAKEGLNISNMTNKSRKNYAYTMVDVQDVANIDTCVKSFEEIEGVLKVRIITN